LVRPEEDTATILFYTSFGKMLRVRVMVFNTTFNNISVISLWWVLLVKETGVPGQKPDIDW